jgi:nicotinamidase-related amidase
MLIEKPNSTLKLKHVAFIKIMKKLIGLFLTLFICQYSVYSQQKENTDIKTALLLVDIQNFYFPGDGPGLVNAEKASLNAKEILDIFREKNQLVVHIRHKSNKGFEIHKNVEPIANEKVITKEEVNSFQGTDLLEYLKSHNITRLIIIGMQTHMCVEAAIRAGHDFGFECIVIQDACATRDVKFMDRMVKAEDVQTNVLATITDGGYGKVIDLKLFKEDEDKYLYQKLE